MTAAFLTLAGLSTAILVWRCIRDDWGSPEWRAKQAERKYAARFAARYPR